VWFRWYKKPHSGGDSLCCCAPTSARAGLSRCKYIRRSKSEAWLFHVTCYFGLLGLALMSCGSRKCGVYLSWKGLDHKVSLGRGSLISNVSVSRLVTTFVRERLHHIHRFGFIKVYCQIAVLCEYSFKMAKFLFFFIPIRGGKGCFTVVRPEEIFPVVVAVPTTCQHMNCLHHHNLTLWRHVPPSFHLPIAQTSATGE